MTYELKNDFLALQVSSRGAEITSMYASDGRQIIWHGDSRYWERHAPLLFPCVGGNWEGIIRVDGIQYPLCKHGFVQDMEFSLIQSTAESLSLAVTDTPETLKSFPFPFRLIVTYTLCGSRLDVAWTVENPAEREMPFLIGAHPAFLLPAFNPADAVHGYLRFPEVDTLVSTPTLPRGYTHPEQTELFPLTDHLLRHDSRHSRTHQPGRTAGCLTTSPALRSVPHARARHVGPRGRLFALRVHRTMVRAVRLGRLHRRIQPAPIY